jgi:hypothetical protein
VTKPQTAAGRALLGLLHPIHAMGYHTLREGILAIEAEAASPDSEALDRIEQDLAKIRGPLEIMAAVQLVEDGRASSMREARAIVRDPVAVDRLLGEADDA